MSTTDPTPVVTLDPPAPAVVVTRPRRYLFLDGVRHLPILRAIDAVTLEGGVLAAHLDLCPVLDADGEVLSAPILTLPVRLLPDGVVQLRPERAAYGGTLGDLDRPDDSHPGASRFPHHPAFILEILVDRLDRRYDPGARERRESYERGMVQVRARRVAVLEALALWCVAESTLVLERVAAHRAEAMVADMRARDLRIYNTLLGRLGRTAHSLIAGEQLGDSPRWETAGNLLAEYLMHGTVTTTLPELRASAPEAEVGAVALRILRGMGFGAMPELTTMARTVEVVGPKTSSAAMSAALGVLNAALATTKAAGAPAPRGKARVPGRSKR